MAYESKGVLNFLGCAKYSFAINIITTFSQGDLVYITTKAERGKLESIFIKKVNIVNQYNWNYQDKENRIWLEEELCDLNKANILINIFLANKLNQQLLLSNNC